MANVHVAVQTENVISDCYYFESYTNFGIHESMLKDEIRTLTYRDAIVDNKHLFADKVILDVGCGTGILSLFAAKAGARRVFALDASDIVEYAKKIVDDNGLGQVVTVIKGKIEDTSLPPEVLTVDVIISEWMGYCLLYESMLSSIIVARDKWLKPGGAIFPDLCSMHIFGIEDRHYQEHCVDWWRNVYGFDMSVMQSQVLKEPVIETIHPDRLVTNSYLIKEIDLYTIQENDIDFSVEFFLRACKNDYINAFGTFFSVEFTKCHQYVGFTTSPKAPTTHWKQTMFVINEMLAIKASEEIAGVFSLKRNSQNQRDLDISIKIEFNGELHVVSLENTFKLC